jgi:hypothetical protein
LISGNSSGFIRTVRRTGGMLMAKQSKKFLQCWITRYIEGQHRHPENIDHTLAECISDASLRGITEKDLADAAGGNLETFLLAEIMKAQKP